MQWDNVLQIIESLLVIGALLCGIYFFRAFLKSWSPLVTITWLLRATWLGASALILEMIIEYLRGRSYDMVVQSYLWLLLIFAIATTKFAFWNASLKKGKTLKWKTKGVSLVGVLIGVIITLISLLFPFETAIPIEIVGLLTISFSLP